VLRFFSVILATLYLGLASAIAILPISQTKIKLFVLQLVLLAPAVVCYGIYKIRRPSQAGAPTRIPRWLPYVIYIAMLIPLAWVSRPGAITDEPNYLFQARIFLSGHLTTDAPPLPAADDRPFMGNIIEQGRWFTKYLPGWPAMLSLGLLLHIEWFWNVVLGLAALWTAERAAGVLYGDPVRMWFTWIMICPFYMLNCLGYMSHPSCALLIAIGVLLFLRACRKPSAILWLGMMLTCVGVIVARPLTGACATLVLAAFSLWKFRSDRKQLTTIVVAGFLCGTLAGAILLLYNHAIAGVWAATLYAFYRGTEVPIEMNFSPANVLRNLTSLTPRGVFLTIVHAFPLGFLLAFYGWWSDREQRWRANFLFALWVTLVAGHIGQSDNSNAPISDRYYFDTFFAFALLAARGLDLLARRFSLAPATATMVLLFLCVSQLPSFALFARNDRLWRKPSQLLQETVAQWPEPGGAVFLAPPLTHPAPDPRAGVAFELVPRHANFNLPDWRHERWFFLADPGEAKRRESACALGRSSWVVVSATAESVEVQSRGETGPCPASRP
jgi:hypothetical protein